MAKLNKYLKLKKQTAELKEQYNKAKGALSQVKKQLKSKFGCSTLEAAEKKLKQFKKKDKELTEKEDTETQNYEERFGKL